MGAELEQSCVKVCAQNLLVMRLSKCIRVLKNNKET